MLNVIIISILEVYPRSLFLRGCQGNYTGEVIPSSEEVELDAGEKCEQGKSVN